MDSVAINLLDDLIFEGSSERRNRQNLRSCSRDIYELDDKR